MPSGVYDHSKHIYIKKQFCKHGHDTFIYGRNTQDRCVKCVEEGRRKQGIGPRIPKQFCINKHDVFICGRDERGNCVDCRAEWDRKAFQKMLSWWKAHPEEGKKSRRKWRIANRERINSLLRERRKTDLNFKIKGNLRHRLYDAIKNNFKAGSAVRDLGCTIDFLKVYLKNMFYGDMSWNNYGIYWEIDHVVALWKFDLTDKEQFLEAVNYTNLQPLTIPDHEKKTAKDAKEYRKSFRK